MEVVKLSRNDHHFMNSQDPKWNKEHKSDYIKPIVKTVKILSQVIKLFFIGLDSIFFIEEPMHFFHDLKLL